LPLNHVPIVALTASALDEDQQMCLEAGVDEFVTKPLDWREFKLKLRRLMARAGKRGAASASLPFADSSRTRGAIPQVTIDVP